MRILPFLICLFLSLFLAKAQAGETLKVPGGVISIDWQTQGLKVSHAEIIRGVNLAVAAVSHYYGKFPVPELRLEINRDTHNDSIFGREFGGRVIRWYIGKNVTGKEIVNDWTLTHEMFHLGFPSFDDAHDWVTEGMATYLEPIARARLGQLSASFVWSQLLDGLPKGLPQKGDRGLAFTSTWGRTYWGGALFWLSADIEIRRKTQNKKSVDDVILAVWRSGGTDAEEWTMQDLIETGDKAVGFAVLHDLNETLALRPGVVDLASLFKKLGVKQRGVSVEFDDQAPWAEFRRGVIAMLKNKS